MKKASREVVDLWAGFCKALANHRRKKENKGFKLSSGPPDDFADSITY